MKLSPNAIIAIEKLTRYLLLPQVRGNKSAFLARAGYSPGNFERLRDDLRTQILTLEAYPVEKTEFGQIYEIAGLLRGPNATELRVRTIWMTEHLTGITKFITLFSAKGGGD